MLTMADEPQRPSDDELSEKMMDSYRQHDSIRHVDVGVFPDRDRTIALLGYLRDLLFPGYFCDEILTEATLNDHTSSLVKSTRQTLESLVAEALIYRTRLDDSDPMHHDGNPDASVSLSITDQFFEQVPEIRRLLATDVQAAFDGDPAARNIDETVFTYPGVLAIMTYRVANVLYRLNVPLLPRLMSEHIHQETGIDIHPGATIGESFFIDHGTGVVIGQTTIIGDRVKLYQGVTLGAMSFPRDQEGRLIRNTKRHPTIEDDVTLYANATILGGNTIVGAGSIVGGSVFLTKSVPPGHYVTLKNQDLRFRSAEVHNRIVTQQEEE
jgi:serine O-acetyltransferase